MNIIKKLFGKKEVETVSAPKEKKVKAPKKVKVKTDYTNGKETYKLEKAQRKIEAAKQRELELAKEAEELAKQEAIRAEENRVAEAIRQEKLEATRKANQAALAAKKDVTKKAEEKLELFGYEIETLKRGDEIEVEVLGSDRENYLVRATTNFQEAKLPKQELDAATINIGDKIKVVVWKLYAEETYVSLRRLKNKEVLKEQMSTLSEEDHVMATVVSYKAPNFMVELDNKLLAKVYVKNMDIKYIDDEAAEAYIGQKFDFLITRKFDNAKVGQTQFELSRRAYLTKVQAAAIEDLAIGKIIEVSAYEFNKGGLEFFYNGIRGFVPIGELAHKYFANVEEASKEVTGPQSVIITEIKKQNGQFNIIGSIKKLQKSPFNVFCETYSEGQEVTGPVVKIENYGMFIEIMPGVRGLLHKSEYSMEIATNIKNINVKDVLIVKIQGINQEEQKIALTANLNDAEGVE